MMIVSLLLVLNFLIRVSASSNYDRQEADARITISQRLFVKGGSSSERTFESQYEIPTNKKGYTKASLELGKKVHKEYMSDVTDDVNKIKEYELPSGQRVNFIDFENKIVYELKPNNPNLILLFLLSMRE